MKKNTLIRIRLLACLLLVGSLLAVAACGKDKREIGTRIYIQTDTKQAYVDLDLSLYSAAPTLYEIIWNHDSLEADIDKTTRPYTIVSICNAYKGAGEAYAVYSSDAADAAAGTAPISYDGIDMYRVSGDYMSLPVKEGCQYLIRLESIA